MCVYTVYVCFRISVIDVPIVSHFLVSPVEAMLVSHETYSTKFFLKRAHSGSKSFDEQHSDLMAVLFFI